mgnify:CR=1 FL=1
MLRWLAVFIAFAFATPLCAQQQEVWIEQFDGKMLHGWQIDGEAVVEQGVIKIGGKDPATLRLTTPLGDKFSIRLEYQYTGPAVPALRWETNEPAPTQWHFHGIPSRWIEMTFNVSQGNWFNRNTGSLAYRTLDNSLGSSSGSGAIAAGAGPARELMIIVYPSTTLTIRRLALQTTPPPPAVGTPWIPVAILVAILVSIVLLGWFLNRRRAESPSTSG